MAQVSRTGKTLKKSIPGAFFGPETGFLGPAKRLFVGVFCPKRGQKRVPNPPAAADRGSWRPHPPGGPRDLPGSGVQKCHISSHPPFYDSSARKIRPFLFYAALGMAKSRNYPRILTFSRITPKFRLFFKKNRFFLLFYGQCSHFRNSLAKNHPRFGVSEWLLAGSHSLFGE